MADISGLLVKNSYDYVLQCDFITGIVYRIGGTIPANPIFYEGLKVNSAFTYNNGSESPGYVLLTDGTGYAYWGPMSSATPSSGVTSITVGNGLSANSSTGAVTIVFTGQTGLSGDYLPLSGGTVTGGTIFTNGISANTISATTYINYPDSYVTGVTFNLNVLTINQNRTDTFSSLTVNLTGLTASTSVVQGITGITATGGLSSNTIDNQTTIINTAPDQTVTITGGTNIQVISNYPNFGINFTGTTGASGDYLPLSGGTVTGGTIFTNGISANTISATTYQNLPDSFQSVKINGITQFSANTGNFINFSGANLTITSGSTNTLVFSAGTGLQYFVSASTPSATLISGDRWFNTDTGIELVWINDGDSQQWVQPFSVPGPIIPDSGYYTTTGITTSQTLTWDKTYWGISGTTNIDLILPTTTLKDGHYIFIKDEAGICGTYRIRLTPASGKIDGNNYVDMNINYMSLTCMVRNGNWYLI
jgi:hypothetical protein